MTATTTPAVLPLDDAGASEVRTTGGKAATLARLRREDFTVPAGFVITADTVAHLLRGMDHLPTLRPAVAEALAELGDGPVAVRSSALAEDQAGTSYAGQYDTVLDVSGTDDVLEAVRKVVDSSRSRQVETYRHTTGEEETRLAVLVQRMVPAESAGVAFSANPVTGARDETLVSAVRGTGEALMSGEADPDEHIVRADAVERVATPQHALDDDQVRQVAALAERLEELFGHPQDIEWAWHDGRLHLLQSRPITALPIAPRVDLPEGSWMKDTSHYPEPLTPLGASAYLEALTEGATAMCRQWGLLVDRLQQRSVGGEVYMSPVPLGGKPGRSAPPWWAIAVLSRVVPPMRTRMKAAARMLEGVALDHLADRWEDEWRPQFQARISRLREPDLDALSDSELAAHLDRVLELVGDGQRLHFHLFLPYAMGIHELVRTSEDLLGWTTGEALDMLHGLSTASSEPARALADLASLVRTHPDALEVMEREENDVLDRLYDIDPRIASAVRAYRDEWGMRTVNYDPGSPTLMERPALLARLLRDAIRGSGDRGGDVHRVRQEARARALAALDAREATPAQRDRFETKLAQAERLYPLREDNVFWTDNVPSALLRFAALEIGRRAAARSLLARAEEAIWLEVDELRDLLEGGSPPGDLRERVERRKGEYRYVRANPGPPVRGTQPAPPPDVRGLPEPARRTNSALLWMMGLEGYQPGPAERSHTDLAGTPASPGRYTGPVRVVTEEGEFERLRPGEVLVCPITTPAWSVLFAQAGAVVTDRGGVLSHAAIVAREHGLPAVLGTGDATRRLQDGTVVTVDANAGTITIEEG